MKQISLTQGKIAIVDDDDYESLSQYKWFAHRSGGGRYWYAGRNVQYPNGKRAMIRMHRTILAAPDNMMVDHQNGNGPDNRRSNLRLCNRQQNSFNCGPKRNSRSGIKGVWWYSKLGKWAASIVLSGRRIHLGYFSDKEDAARRYNEATCELFGEFAGLNANRAAENVGTPSLLEPIP